MNHFANRSLLVATTLVLVCICVLSWFEKDLRVWSRSSVSRSPVAVGRQEFVGSNACRECHQEQYDSWFMSYHRSMTQVADNTSLIPKNKAIQLKSNDLVYRFEEREGKWWVDMPDPEWQLREMHSRQFANRRIRSIPRIRGPIVMTTGSHHQQCFWVRGKSEADLWMVPWSYHIQTDSWVPMEQNFVRPHTSGTIVSKWNDNCMSCHNVAGSTNVSPTGHALETRVAELGIACEACHGSGEGHIAQVRSSSDLTLPRSEMKMVNPKNLPHQRASEVCGQCHSMSVENDFQNRPVHGSTFQPGDDLRATRTVLESTMGASPPRAVAEALKQEQLLLKNAFWADGTMRSPGRDLNALEQSACYQKGSISCLDCHSMHHYADRADQLSISATSDQSCLSCHPMTETEIGTHTHHKLNSSGSRCYNCHMPHTTFGLMKAIRSHRITSPQVDGQLHRGRPNACNLCHLDQTLKWAADNLSNWYGKPRVAVDQDSSTIAASLVWLYKGDAAQRSVVAWHAGWEPTRPFVSSWISPHLQQQLEDSYAVVRATSCNSLQKLGVHDSRPANNLRDFEWYDKLKLEIEQDVAETVRSLPQTEPRWLWLNGGLDMKAVKRLLSERDQTPISVRE